MQVTVEIPDALVQRLRDAVGEDLGRAAIERFAREGYETGKLSRYEVQQLLGFDNRWETERWLGEHGVGMNYSSDDLESDRKTLDEVLGD